MHRAAWTKADRRCTVHMPAVEVVGPSAIGHMPILHCHVQQVCHHVLHAAATAITAAVMHSTARAAAMYVSNSLQWCCKSLQRGSRSLQPAFTSIYQKERVCHQCLSKTGETGTCISEGPLWANLCVVPKQAQHNTQRALSEAACSRASSMTNICIRVCNHRHPLDSTSPH